MKCMRPHTWVSKLTKSITKNSLLGESSSSTLMIIEKSKSVIKKQKRFKKLDRSFKKKEKVELPLMKSQLIKLLP